MSDAEPRLRRHGCTPEDRALDAGALCPMCFVGHLGRTRRGFLRCEACTQRMTAAPIVDLGGPQAPAVTADSGPPARDTART